MHCLITAGPTREHLDPVRFLSNGSSGKMGYALAAAAVARGWSVDLVSGPVALAPPAGVRLMQVVSAEEMFNACARCFDACDLFIAVAAVADYRPATQLREKGRKAAGPTTLELVPTVDILRTLGSRKRSDQLVVGFAAETVNVVETARQKMAAKNCDWMVANDVSRPGVGMDADDNAVVLLGPEGTVRPFGPAAKSAVADFLLTQIAPA